MEVNNENVSDSMEKIEKQRLSFIINLALLDYFV